MNLVNSEIGDGLPVIVEYECEQGQEAIYHGDDAQEGFPAEVIIDAVRHNGVNILEALNDDTKRQLRAKCWADQESIYNSNWS